MASKEPVQLGQIQETLLIPLYARALESRRKRPVLDDPKAVAMVESIDWDFHRFGQRTRVFACAARSAMFDVWVAEFLREHPQGTVVEIGAGLNTRFERLDNGRVHWFDLDLPDVVELRRKFFSDSERRTTLGTSVLAPEWMEEVRRSPGPYFFVAETVLVYLEEPQVKAALSQIARTFPGARIAFDTVGRRAVEGGNRDFVRRKLAARFAWACENPRELESWNIGLRLVESRTMMDIPEALRPRLSVPLRAVLALCGRVFPGLARTYQFGLFAGEAEA